MGVHVFRSPRGGLDIFLVATSKAHAVGRTVGGLVGVVLVVSSYGRRIDQFFGKGERPGLGGLGEAGRALGVAAKLQKTWSLDISVNKKNTHLQKSMPQGANAVPWVPHDEAALKTFRRCGEI